MDEMILSFKVQVIGMLLDETAFQCSVFKLFLSMKNVREVDGRTSESSCPNTSLAFLCLS